MNSTTLFTTKHIFRTSSIESRVNSALTPACPYLYRKWKQIRRERLLIKQRKTTREKLRHLYSFSLAFFLSYPYSFLPSFSLAILLTINQQINMFSSYPTQLHLSAHMRTTPCLPPTASSFWVGSMLKQRGWLTTPKRSSTSVTGLPPAPPSTLAAAPLSALSFRLNRLLKKDDIVCSSTTRVWKEQLYSSQ